MATDANANNLRLESLAPPRAHAYVASLNTVSGDELASLMRLVVHARIADHAAVVSTCSRVEVYAARELEQLRPPNRFLHLQGLEAIEHLAAVAAGAESIVVGETDVLAQVRAAFAAATGDLRQFGDVAVAAAREARAHVDFTAPDAGRQLDLALALAATGAPQSVTIVGTGAMARHLARRSQEIGVPQVSVCGRHSRRAAALAGELGVAHLPVESLPQAAAGTCLILAFKGVPSASLRKAIVAAARGAGLVIDLTMPSFDWPARTATVIDLEMLSRRRHEQPEDLRLREELRAIAVDAVRRKHQGSLTDGAALAVDLYRHIEQLRVAEVLRAQTHCAEDRALADRVSKAIVKKLFHTYGKALRASDDPALIDMTRQFFLEAAG
jgi:glutamyl-tRNA reductase